MSQIWLMLAVMASGLTALAFARARVRWLYRRDPGSAKLQEIAGYIRTGALAFLKAEYRYLGWFVGVVAVLLAVGGTLFGSYPRALSISLAFVSGALASGAAGYFGMRTATRANVRTAHAATRSLGEALSVAFTGGSVMGLYVVGLALCGMSFLLLLFCLLTPSVPSGTDWNEIISRLAGFSLGASSIALFARVGGGIYTKAADVGADLVGKVENSIPEDDPRNPAVIADNVGDNVGDVAGMGADLFESFAGAIVGAMILGAAFGGESARAVLLPLVLAGVGTLASIMGNALVKVDEGGDPQRALNGAVILADLVMVAAAFFLCSAFAGDAGLAAGDGRLLFGNDLFFATITGLGAGIAVGLTTEYYCSTDRGPVRKIAHASLTGPATTVIAGMAVGMRSTALPVIWIAAAVVLADHFAGLYGVAIAAVGMLSTTGIQLAVDAYGPISDNAGGLAQMAGLPKEVRARTDKLDAVGNTTAAIGKGFAIGSAALTALAMFVAFRQQANIEILDLTQPAVMCGLFLGAMLPFFFTSMALEAVGEAAYAMVEEVRRQFREIPGLLKGKKGVKAEYAKCVTIATEAALKRMAAPGIMAVVAPMVVGAVSKHALGGLLAGVTVSGVILAIFQANAGGAWDNAKKYIESGVHGGKGSQAHKAAVIGDTVGDPLKDTAGPSINILIKLIAVVSLVLAPFL